MKLAVIPPPWRQLFEHQAGDLGRNMSVHLGPEVKGRYEPWDHLRHLTPPDGLTAELWWLGIKLARSAPQRRLPVLDKLGHPLTVVLSDSTQRKLFFAARDAAGALRGQGGVQPDSMRERYLMRSLLEEAMTSSQLEGAATAPVAKDMLRSARQPRDCGERMIYNNYVPCANCRSGGGVP